MSYIRQAAQAGANLTVLPEYHLGELPQPEGVNIHDLCIHWQKYLDSYCALAKELGICIVPGSLAEIRGSEGEGAEKPVNATYFIDNNGQILGRYEKKNLWHPERGQVVPGKAPHRAFNTPLGRVGLLICWDLGFPEAFRELVADGAKMIVMPSYWKLTDAGDVGQKWNPESEKVFMNSALVTRACENTCAIVYCNVGGSKEDGFVGCSQVTAPFLGCVWRAETSEEQMKIIELDMNVVDDAESVYKVREDMASPCWQYTRYNQRVETKN